MTPTLDGAELEFFHGSPATALPLLRAAADTEPRARWLVGAALGALGRYGEARSQLTDVISEASPPCASLAASTLASHYRQLGRHLDAREWDDRAHTLAGDDVEARFDARLGLAADAVGIGDVDAAHAGLAAALAAAGAGSTATRTGLAAPPRAGLARQGSSGAGGHSAAAGLPAPIGTWRQQVRIGWVETEVALLSGDPDAAIRSATAGLAVAEAAGAPRHVAKCLLFLGASQHVAAEPEPIPTETLERAATAAEAVDALPLRWVCAALLAERADGRGESDLALIQRRIAAAAIQEIGAGLPLSDRKSWLDRVDIAGIVALSR